ncbi:thioredoxin domain-containing protein [Nocardioides sp. KIGAM211]|uniref:Thioredoxin domain-containing protein n=1 Tax=Nocardioides luti TaxID=2761101 RepID=A0A7X0RGT0_9ACTN|nr:thioredoxin domain-containing protein [Nocardioides luti]MBB6626768.1 thioredoxin domain-containing protein [Nocardioides luti]
MSSKASRDARAERAALALRDQQRAERRRSVLMIGGVVLAMVLIVTAGFLVNRARDTSNDVSAPAAGSGDYGVTVGDRTAPRTVVVYEDFLCPYCGELEKATHEELASLADAGKVYVEYRPFDLLRTDYSVAAASAFKVVLDASGPEVAKKFHDELYADQPDESGPYPDADWLVEKAVAAGATESDVRPGIEDDSQKAWVEKATKAADAAGVTGTPTVLLDGKRFTDGTTIDDLATNLLAQLK